MRVKWEDSAVESARRFLRDQPGLLAVGEAVAALAGQPYPPPPLGVHHGDYHRLHVGEYRVLYKVGAEVITIERVDRVTG